MQFKRFNLVIHSVTAWVCLGFRPRSPRLPWFSTQHSLRSSHICFVNYSKSDTWKVNPTSSLQRNAWETCMINIWESKLETFAVILQMCMDTLHSFINWQTLNYDFFHSFLIALPVSSIHNGLRKRETAFTWWSTEWKMWIGLGQNSESLTWQASLSL